MRVVLSISTVLMRTLSLRKCELSLLQMHVPQGGGMALFVARHVTCTLFGILAENFQENGRNQSDPCTAFLHRPQPLDRRGMRRNDRL